MSGSRPSRPSPAPLDPARRRRLQGALLTWYDAHGRSLPWRDTGDSYRVLVSEFMLQQTQVTTVLPYFDRFLTRFPTLGSLARADDTEVRAVWSGLGYYRRARHLREAARVLVDEHRGVLPDRLDLIRSLPGVGAYTAAALGSIVHGIPKAVVDGNVIRVLTRLAAIREPVHRTSTRRQLADLADALLEPGRPGDWNQAVMELGATLCTPRAPRCPACPWRNACAARREGNPEAYPVKPAERAALKVERALGILRRKGAVLLIRRDDPRLLDETWEFPGVDVPPGEDSRAALAHHLKCVLGKRVRIEEEIARVKHSITHRRITVLGYAVTARVDEEKPSRCRWVRPSGVDALPVSSMTTKVLRALDEGSRLR